MDFLGNQPQSSPAPAGSPAVSEGSFITSPTFRMRHLALKLETPAIDVLAGQYWQLFGWQSYFHPNTVEIQGVPGEIYSRAPQLRISHLFKNDDVSVEIAVAASRPPQRDSATPDGQGGLRFALNNWKGVHTAGAAGTALDPLSIGVSGVGCHFRIARVLGDADQQRVDYELGRFDRRPHPAGATGDDHQRRQRVDAHGLVRSRPVDRRPLYRPDRWN